MLTSKDIKEFKRICEEEFDHPCTDSQAEAMARRVIRYLLATEDWEDKPQLTDQEHIVVDLIKKDSAHGHSSSIREITKALGFSSSRSGYRVLQGLIEKKIVSRDQKGALICTK
jgi:hypothetical protein